MDKYKNLKTAVKSAMLAGVAMTTAVVAQQEVSHADTLANIQSQHKSGYLNADGQWLWFENGQRYTGFRFYMGTYYWFINGVRQDSGWREAWGMKYYTDNQGRAVQGNRVINGVAYNFGDNGTFFLRGKTSGYTDAGEGWKWYEGGQKFTGFRFYMGTYYWFENGVRQQNKWENAWGMKYYVDGDGRASQGVKHVSGGTHYFGNDGTFFERSIKNAMPDQAKKMLGLPYAWGGKTWSGVDCAGYVALVRSQAGLPDIGSVTWNQAAYLRSHGSQPKSYSQAQPGDLLFWGGTGNEYHVGIYLGNGQMIDSATYGTVTGIRGVWGDPQAYTVNF
ncbi:NlpC/P60 family protein [Weissella cibaria]|uniref:NlpC/P60 family protein n=1 Tax=Weissella cibaria TaxID=137591 RepID=UPI00223C08CA|nr:NlpC/P60 family protein [Weissella cibaria]MCT0954608.1 NlpC/P60 family protein [Weissella cibaria]